MLFPVALLWAFMNASTSASISFDILATLVDDVPSRWPSRPRAAPRRVRLRTGGTGCRTESSSSSQSSSTPYPATMVSPAVIATRLEHRILQAHSPPHAVAHASGNTTSPQTFSGDHSRMEFRNERSPPPPSPHFVHRWPGIPGHGAPDLQRRAPCACPHRLIWKEMRAYRPSPPRLHPIRVTTDPRLSLSRTQPHLNRTPPPQISANPSYRRIR